MRRLPRHTAPHISGLAALALLLGASAPATAAAPLTLQLWHGYHAAEQEGLERAVVAWNAAHPEATVEPLAIPVEGFAQKLEAAIPHGHGPDLFIAAHEHTGEWAQAGLVAPIDERTVDTSAFLDGTLAPLRAGGHLYGLPLAFKSVALYYRTDLIATPPRTTDELTAQCAILVEKHPGGARYCLAYEAGSGYYHAAFLHGFGGRLLDDDGRPDLASPQGVAALEFVRSLARRHFLPDETTGAVVGELFNDGRAALAINGPWFLGDIRAGVPFAIAPLPIVSSTGRPAAPLLTVEAVMFPPAPAAQDPARADAARAFGRWLAGPEASLIRARVGRQPVADKATWSLPEIANDPLLAPFRAQLAATVAMPNRREMGSVWEPLQQALRRVLRGAALPREALLEADRRIAITQRAAPPPASPLSLVLLLGLASLAAAVWLVARVRRERALAATRPLGPPGQRGAGAFTYLAPTLLAMLVLVFIPFAVGVGMAFCYYDSAAATGPTWRFVGLANFASILSARDFAPTDPLSFYFTLVVTALWTVVNVALHVLIGGALALLLRNPLLRLRAVYRVLLVVPWAVPNYITALIWRGMFQRQFGAINALLVLVGAHPVSWFSSFATAFAANVTTNVWLGFPFMMVVTLGELSRIPRALEEAAALDGATRWQTLRRIVLPLLAPALLPSVVLGAVWTFNMFNVVFLVSGGEPDGSTDILVSQAYRWAFTRGHQYGYAAAYAVLIFLVLVGQFMLGRRSSSEPD